VHPNPIVSEDERLIKCGTCGAAINAFDFILEIAKREASLSVGIQQLKDEHKKTALRLGKIRKLETRLRVRIYRNVKDPELKNWIKELFSWRY
jgi:hypothetical protein